MKDFLQKYKHPLLFIILFSGICLSYNFYEIFQYSPRSTHQWRQSDSASIALNYYQDGLHFFKPRVHYAMGGEGYVTGTGEAPIFYYFIALLYKVFGPTDGIFRLCSLLILLAGFYCLSKIILKQSQDIFIALFIPGLMMGSPVIAYYSFNFTPNIPAQGIAMIGIWFFYLFYQKSKLRFLYLSLFFFTLAGLIKISALMVFFVILGIWAIELLNIFKLKKGEKLFKNNFKIAPAFLMVIVTLFFWKMYADYYNQLHQTNYFLSKIRPIWDIDEATREFIWNKITEKRLPSFFHPYTFWTIVSIGVLLLLTPRRHNPFMYIAFSLLIIGCISFFLLMFKQFEQHDYYAIELIFLPLSILSLSMFFLKKSLKKWWVKVILTLILIFNISYTKSHLDSIYKPNNTFMSHFNSNFYKKVALQNFIKELGIKRTDKVVSAPDLSPNNTLYYLNLRGWSEYFMGSKLNSLVMDYFISSGAKYLIINDQKYLESEDLKPFLNYPIGDFENSIFVYDIRPYKLKEKEIIGTE